MTDNQTLILAVGPTSLLGGSVPSPKGPMRHSRQSIVHHNGNKSDVQRSGPLNDDSSRQYIAPLDKIWG
jgi:hypothetical protein